MADVPVHSYYNELTQKERSYVNYMNAVHESISSGIERSANRQIAANAMFTSELQSTLVNNQIASETAMYNHTQQLGGVLAAGFSDVSRQLGEIGSSMSMGFALLNRSVMESSKTIYDKLDEINNTLKNPLYNESKELYNRAVKNYIKGHYEEVIEDI